MKLIQLKGKKSNPESPLVGCFRFLCTLIPETGFRESAKNVDLQTANDRRWLTVDGAFLGSLVATFCAKKNVGCVERNQRLLGVFERLSSPQRWLSIPNDFRSLWLILEKAVIPPDRMIFDTSFCEPVQPKLLGIYRSVLIAGSCGLIAGSCGSV